MSPRVRANPLRKDLRRDRAVEPCLAVIFGGTGDLAKRKLLPALYHLCAAGLLPRGFAIVSYSSPDISDEQYRAEVCEALKQAIPNVMQDSRCWSEFVDSLHHVRRTDDYDASVRNLKSRISEIDRIAGAGGNYLFYLAVPPASFVESIDALGAAGLARDPDGQGWRRIVIEKPFGVDEQSARALNECLLSTFNEEQVYRIDHYLGKETVQNLLVFRFANQVVEPLLNAQFVDHIQITVAETLGVGNRAKFYDSTGALRDIVQNHALELMALTCMDRPDSLGEQALRDEKIKIFRSVRPIDPQQVEESVVRGRYAAGSFMGEDVRAYLQEKGVDPKSVTETYVALRLHIDNQRWRGVPIYIRTGKRLAKRVTEIAIQLNEPELPLFGKEYQQTTRSNVIAINVQPDEGISVRFEAKIPGYDYRIQPVKMDFRYGTAFGKSVPEAYERLLLDAFLGDPSLFARGDAAEAAWKIVDPIVEGFREMAPPVFEYAPGGWGPAEASALLERDGRRWRRL